MTTINLHGHLGESIGKTWKLDVSSVSEAMHAINIISKRKLYKYLLELDKAGAKYKVLINNKLFKSKKPLTANSVDDIKNSELVMNRSNLQTIDIVPVIEGAEDVFAIILGIVLIIVGIVAIAAGGSGALLIAAGIGLVAAGVINLLAAPPKFEDFTEGKKARSYLFNGPENVTREGGPVPIGYGRLIVGSQVISASYEIVDTNATQFEQ